MLLLNKREERMAVRGGYLLLMYYKHREISREHRENTGKTQGINLKPNVATLLYASQGC